MGCDGGSWTKGVTRFEVIRGGVEVRGFSTAEMETLRAASVDSLKGTFHLHVDSESMPAMVGIHQTMADGLRFEPRFPLRPGVDYVAILSLEGLDQATSGRRAQQFSFVIPMETKEPSTVVLAISPSVPKLPENLLRFYLHFSAPMASGNAYQYIQLLDGSGAPVDDAFLRLEEELWDADAKRLTLLFDPGRIKSGLVPQRELGAAITTGRDFELTIDPSWPDAEGTPLVKGYRHRFTTSPPDHQSSDPNQWRLTLPRAGTRELLLVDLDEPLDAALLERLVTVRNAQGTLEGVPDVTRDGTRWEFEPDQAWQAGLHQLSIDVRLEDLAGNRIDRLFERENLPGAASSNPNQPAAFVQLAFALEPMR